MARAPSSAKALASTTAVAALLLLALAPSSVSAGCKRGRDRSWVGEENKKEETHSSGWVPSTAYASIEDAPASLDWGNVSGSSLLTPSWNQHIPIYCGSCWLHGTTSMLQDRLKVAKNGLGPDVMLARQVVLNCGAFSNMGGGCDGGDVIDVLHYAREFGMPDESCQVYEAVDHTRYGKKATRCPASGVCRNCWPIDGKDVCWGVHTPILYYVSEFGRVEEPGELAMLNELARGPITCSLATPDDFDFGYHRGVYVDRNNASDVDHDVEIVGWGEEEAAADGTPGLKYWIVRNSWGTYFGELGFFKLQRGVNALQIEAGDCWGAQLSWKDEQDIRSGAKVGTMWGIFTPEEADKIIPEAHRHPHDKPEDLQAFADAVESAVLVELDNREKDRQARLGDAVSTA